ncbi:MAG: acyl-CoA dehydrogenase family protein [Nitrospirota bacterium]
MDERLSSTVRELRSIADTITREHIAPRSQEVDADSAWPAHSMRALASAGLTGLHVPRRLGGHEQGLLALAVISETIARGCASSAMCYAMHCVGTAVIAAKATKSHDDRYLRPIAEGRHVTTLALSEAGTGIHFYLPQTDLERRDDEYVVRGAKHFVTNGGCADSYVVSTKASRPDAEPGEFSCLVVDAGAPGLTWLDAWKGLGMRGNSSRAVRFDDVRVPADNLLGREGDQIWFVFEVVAPYFLMAMAGVYLGVARAALDIVLDHLRNRRYEHAGGTLADAPVLQHKAAEMWIAVERTRALVYHAARLGDLGDPTATSAIMAAKADAGDTSVWVANEAMTCCGGMAYRDNSHLARLLRDARASHVMAPTTDILKVWLGRSLLGLPLL